MLKSKSKEMQATGVENTTIATLTKPVSVAALMLALGTAGISAHAVTLNVGDILTINPGITIGDPNVTDTGAYQVLCSGSSVAAYGSCFGTQGPPATFAYISIAGHNGIIIGSTQPASGSHSGLPGTVAGENPGIDNPWSFYGNTGMHQTTSPITQLTSTATGGTLNFSGWNITWNGTASIPMGSGGTCQLTGNPAANGSNCNGSASFQWDGTYGHQYQLWYNATIVTNDSNLYGFDGTKYRLHLVGTVQAAVPLPAAVWLLGSGLIVGLVGLGRRETK
jgi:hypothetical protein